MKKKGEQFHPSRDKRPAEYSIEGEGIRIPGEGLYEDADEIHRATEYWKEEGVADHPLFRPLQGRLFDAEEHEADQRLALGRKRFVPTGDAADEGRAAGVRDRAMLHSRIPTSHLQERRSSSGGAKPETLFDITNEGAGWTGAPYGGYYRGPALNTRSDLISAKPGPGEVNTFVHEQGHRRHLGELPAWADTATHPRGRYPDPLKEGIADGYADRYGGPDDLQVKAMSRDIEDTGQKFGAAYQTTGYSTNEESAKDRGWDDTDRALYAATRAHASETGEEPAYRTFGRNNMEESGMAVGGGSVDPTVDATLHHLLSTSPHAVQALRQTELKGVGAESFQRHEDRMLMNQGQEVQGALFHEMTGHTSGEVHGYEPDSAIIYGNMMAETPRLPLRERAAKLGEHMDAMDERHAALEAEHGELVFPQSMSHNQFGKKPRTESDVNQTLGVSAKNAAKRGFPARS